MLTIGNDAQFQRFCEFANCVELGEDERFSTNGARVINRSKLIDTLMPILASRSSQEWLSELQRLTIGCGPINTIDQVFADPHVKNRNMVVNMPHEAVGGREVPLVANPLRLSDTPVSYRYAPPVLGADTEGVLRELLDIEDDELISLREKAII